MAEDVEGARGLENGARRIGPRKAGPTREDIEMIERTRAARDLLASKWKVDLLYLLARGAQRYSRLYDNPRGRGRATRPAPRSGRRPGGAYPCRRP
jgi:hypothetical protein